MSYTITTTYKTNAKGTGQIVAKGGGKQKTVSYDHGKSINQNHGSAAAVLFKSLNIPSYLIADGSVMVDRENGKATFTF